MVTRLHSVFLSWPILVPVQSSCKERKNEINEWTQNTWMNEWMKTNYAHHVTIPFITLHLFKSELLEQIFLKVTVVECTFTKYSWRYWKRNWLHNAKVINYKYYIFYLRIFLIFVLEMLRIFFNISGDNFWSVRF